MICEPEDEGEWELPEFERNVFELFEDNEDKSKLFCFYYKNMRLFSLYLKSMTLFLWENISIFIS